VLCALWSESELPIRNTKAKPAYNFKFTMKHIKM
jgi:hypothetical protein